MGDKKKNLKSLFTNTRSRLIIIATGVVLIIAIIVGVLRLQKNISSQSDVTTLSDTPQGIQSIPGGLNPTQQYSKLQMKQNVEQAKSALKRGQSAIPTIIKSQKFAEGVKVVGSKDGEGSVGFSTLARERGTGGARSLWEEELKKNACNKATIDKLMQQGAALEDIKKACSCQELKVAGFKIDELSKVCSCKGLRKAGFNAMELKNLGYTAKQLRACGFDACALKNAGFTAKELADAGFSDGELKGAGFTEKQRAQALGLPQGVSIAEIKKAGCEPSALKKLRARGVSARAIRYISGCSPSDLKAAGYTASQLRKAGFTAAELKRAGFSPKSLKDAGYSAHDLLNAGFTPQELAKAGYSNDAIRAALSKLPAGILPEDIKRGGCNEERLRTLRRAGVSAVAIKKYTNCSAEQLAKAGFDDRQLQFAGFTPKEIAAAHRAMGSKISLPNGVSEAEVEAAGCNVEKLKALKAKGVSADAIRKLNHCSAKQLKDAGYSAEDLLKGGYSRDALKSAGFTPDEIQAALNKLAHLAKLPNGVSYRDVKKAGCDPEALRKLKEKGVTAAAIVKINGCSAKALRQAGYSAGKLLGAGFTADALDKAGFTPDEVSQAVARQERLAMLPKGVTEEDMKKAGCDPTKLNELRNKGVTANAIHLFNHCSAAELKKAGFSARALKRAGFSDSELKQAGFTPDEIKEANIALPKGITVNRIKSAGCDPVKLRELRNENVSAIAIQRVSKCPDSALQKAGFSPKQIKAADDAVAADELARLRQVGCTPEALKAAKNAGLSALSIRKTIGCTARQMRKAGFTLDDLKAAGFTPGELAKAGFPLKDLLSAGFTPDQLRQAGLWKEKDENTTGIALPPGITAEMVKDAGCDPDMLKELKSKGVKTEVINKLNGCSSQESVALPSGITEDMVKSAGCDPKKLKKLREAGVTAKAIRKINGCSAASLLAAGFSPDDLKDAGFSKAEIAAGKKEMQSRVQGLPEDNVLKGIDSAAGGDVAVKSQAERNANKLQKIFEQQQKHFSGQRFQQQIEQAASQMMGASQQAITGWRRTGTQSLTYIGEPVDKDGGKDGASSRKDQTGQAKGDRGSATGPAVIRAGDIMFAVLDTSINSDEPGPILATIVAGRFKGARLIGAFTLPSEGQKLILNFNMMSVQGAPQATSITAVAIDPNTARTALSSRTDNHYLLRYGSLFASSFIEGFGNAFQSAGTTVTIGGTASSDISIQQGVGRSVLENAVIGLADVGKQWGQQARQLMNRQPTVYVYSGTALGILFTRDIKSI